MQDKYLFPIWYCFLPIWLVILLQDKDTFPDVLSRFVSWYALKVFNSSIGPIGNVLERYKSHGLDPSNATFVTCGQWDLESMLPQQCLYSGKAFFRIKVLYIHSLLHRFDIASNVGCGYFWWVSFSYAYEIKWTMYDKLPLFRWVCQHQADLSKHYWAVWKGT